MKGIFLGPTLPSLPVKRMIYILIALNLNHYLIEWLIDVDFAVIYLITKLLAGRLLNVKIIDNNLLRN